MKTKFPAMIAAIVMTGIIGITLQAIGDKPKVAELVILALLLLSYFDSPPKINL